MSKSKSAPKSHLDAFTTYMTVGSRDVEGWIGERLHLSLAKLGALQLDSGVQGNACEVGVYMGRLSIGLSWLLRPQELLCAVDIFDDQWMNIDSSGVGASRRQFETNWGKHANPDTQLRIYQADSLALPLAKRWEIFVENGPFRLFSIDGGHQTEHVINDLKIAVDSLAAGGVVLVDDYLNPYWPGVHEGVAKLMHSGHLPLRPFALHQNKLFMCNVTYGDSYLNPFVEEFGAGENAKVTEMFGYKTLVFV